MPIRDSFNQAESMRLHEYHTKTLFARSGIPVLSGELAGTPGEARAAAERFRMPVVVNAQVLADERVFRVAQTPLFVEQIAAEMLTTQIAGYRVHQLLIEPMIDVTREFALVIEFDQSRGRVEIAASTLTSKRTCSELLDPFIGVQAYKSRYLASGIDLPSELWSDFVAITQKLFQCYVDYDATRASILPLALTRAGNLIALGGKLDIDDSALFRQAEIAALRDVLAENDLPSRQVAENVRLSRLPGDIACIANGAGLAMMTADSLANAQRALSPGAVIEITGEPSVERLQAALQSLPSNTRGVIINLFCDRFSASDAAKSLMGLLVLDSLSVPLVVRLAGQDAERAHEWLSAQPATLYSVTSLAHAVELLSHSLSDETSWQS
ncbi:MAG: hypothetical protein JNL42_23970 [Anaerolineae bacterium]|nr:hypothetical protein [Anaerolineae bacterium]